MTPLKLLFVTGNAQKLDNVRDILGSAVELESVSLEVPELQGTIEEIARDKCQRAADILQKPVLIEDTSLAFNALGELPGPYIRSFFEALGNENLHKMLAAFEDKSAQVICTFAYSPGPGCEPVLFQETMNGIIVPPRGSAINSWNPSFECEGKTIAEMTKEERMKISGRRRALVRLQAWMLEDLRVNLGKDSEA